MRTTDPYWREWCTKVSNSIGIWGSKTVPDWRWDDVHIEQMGKGGVCDYLHNAFYLAVSHCWELQTGLENFQNTLQAKAQPTGKHSAVVSSVLTHESLDRWA